MLATTIGGTRDRAVTTAIDYGERFGGDQTVPVPGTGSKLDPLRASLAIGLAAHLDDYDDTHLATVIHPGAAALAATFAVGAPNQVSGSRFLRAFALGCEVQLRAGIAMTPWHYDRGWHITGTCAPLGAAVTAALLTTPRPDPDLIERALSLAACMSLGHREAFGSMIKPFHPGKGAANGVLAASLARSGQNGLEDALGREGGFFSALSSEHRPERLNDQFGHRWELLNNTFKPYPCGIVCHPAIDAATDLAKQLHDQLAEVTAIEVYCHPLVAELTGNPQPTTGLQAKFSTIHGVAAGLCDGQVSLPQYTDARAAAADVTRLRSLTRLVVEPDRSRDSARLMIRLRDGSVLTRDVVHARGSLERPLTQDELEEKVTGLIEPRIPGGSTRIIETAMNLHTADHLDPFIEACCPPSTALSGDGRQDVTA